MLAHLNTLVMNPRMKTQYFIREQWLQEWIDAALEIVRNEWKRYKPASDADNTIPHSEVRRLYHALDKWLTALVGRSSFHGA